MSARLADMAKGGVSRGLACAVCALALAGCSTQAWYDGLKQSAQNECRRQTPGDVESCLARVNTMSYDEYERRRSGPKP